MGQAVQIESLWNGLTDSSGNALASGKVYTYEPGTTTNKTTWTDQAKATPAANPIILDAAGKAEIWADGVYDLKIDDADDNNLTTISSAVYLLNNGVVTWGGTSGGSSSNYTISPTPALNAYAAGNEFAFEANHTNSGATTLNVSSLGTKAIQDANGNALVGNEIVSGSVYKVIYDGTAFILINGVSPLTIQNSYTNYKASGGSSSAYTLDLDPDVTAYVAGQRFTFNANHTSDGTCTLNVNGLGAKTIQDAGAKNLIANCIESGQIVDVIYDGTVFRILMERFSEWIDYTPTYSGGNGLSLTGTPVADFSRYKIQGKNVHIEGHISDLVINSGGGTLLITSPTGLNMDSQTLSTIGTCIVAQASGDANRYSAKVYRSTSTTFGLERPNEADWVGSTTYPDVSWNIRYRTTG